MYSFIDTFSKHGNEWVFRNHKYYVCQWMSGSLDPSMPTEQHWWLWQCGSSFLSWIFHHILDLSERGKLGYWDSVLQIHFSRKLRDFDFLLPYCWLSISISRVVNWRIFTTLVSRFSTRFSTRSILNFICIQYSNLTSCKLTNFQYLKVEVFLLDFRGCRYSIKILLYYFCIYFIKLRPTGIHQWRMVHERWGCSPLQFYHWSDVIGIGQAKQYFP